MTDSNSSPRLSRRSLLAGATAGVAATAGCVSRFQRTIGRGDETQLTLDIMTLPAELDPFGVRIANYLRANLEAVGIDTTLTLANATNLAEAILLRHDFDIYVGELPYTRAPDPDALYPLFGSAFDTEVGWQNPFGFTHLGCDDLLEDQRTADGESRARAVGALQNLLARTQPVSPLVAPDLLTGVRTDSFEADSWVQDDPTRPHNLLKLSPTGDEPGTLGLAVVDDNINSNRNPIAARYRQEDSLVDLLYDSLALEDDGDYIPWAAREFSWDEPDGRPEVTVRLRDGLQWHDGEHDMEAVTAFDVAFSYELLRDTSLGSASRPIPSERYRGRVSLVDDIQVINSRSLRLTFTETTRAVAERALTVPILPADIWRPRAELEHAWSRSGRTTAALLTANPAAIGSGPIRFESEGDDVVEFSLFEDHFLWRSLTPTPDEQEQSTDDTEEATETAPNETVENTSTATADETIDSAAHTEEFEAPPDGYGDPPFEQLVVEIVGSDNAAAELLITGGVDATIARIRSEIGGPIESDDSLKLIEHRSNAFYHLGFNTRRQPLRNPNVRRLIARLVDKPTLVEEYFDGYGVPVASLLAETDWITDALRWDPETNIEPEVPFIGTDGELDVERAREQFRAVGYEYTDSNELIIQSR